MLEKKDRKQQSETEDTKKQGRSSRISLFLIGLALSFIALGALLIFVPGILPIHLCYAVAGLVMVFGIILIVHYFLTEAYKNIQHYGFSIGVILVILGSIGLVKAETVSLFFLFLLGALMLLGAIFKLQNALDLKALKDSGWGFWFLVAICFAVLAILVILNPFGSSERLRSFAQYAIFIDGIVSLIGALYLQIRLKKVISLEQAELSLENASEEREETEFSEEREPEIIPGDSGEDDDVR